MVLGVFLFFSIPFFVSFFFMFNNFMSVLIILENFNLLLLCILVLSSLFYVCSVSFIVVLSVLTIEVLFGLLLITSSWNINSLGDFFVL
uniref:NADH dehydrogenase subunit 4L n=1 Tax=Paradiplozoon yunnanensis TaxID=2268894 RepID=UPI001FB00A8A|nr:NADH dehydrogenase subunit 4L [Paradiplozoon yunnanensis]UKP90068.1 NADH dehydrogenase subunit 4L [Paradiplozoon yunnanensis]